LNWPLTVFGAGEIPISPGARVRVTYNCRLLTPSTTGHCKMAGRLARWEPDSLSVATSEQATIFALRDLNRLEVSQGQKSYRFLGGGLGAVIGAGATYLILNSGGSTAPCDRSANQDAMSSSECLGLYALGGLAGAGLGFLIGSVIHSERWQNVSH
jgi:hypothetical protein